MNSHSTSRGSFESGRPRPSLDGLAETTEEQEEEKVEGRSEHERLEGGTAGQERKVEESIDLGSGSALGFVNTQATLIEQNADLLSFIAKKERKCLDLREGELVFSFLFSNSNFRISSVEQKLTAISPTNP